MKRHSSFPKKKSIRTGTIAPRRPRSKKEEQEFGQSKKDYVICPDCNSVYFGKSWHHSLEEGYAHLRFDKMLRFKICPACKMKRDKTFEGELVVDLSGVAPNIGEEIMKIIDNSDRQAQNKDPLDRVLRIEKTSGEMHVYTSENQLAVRIGKKLKSAFKGSVLKIAHSEEEDAVRVYWKI